MKTSNEMYQYCLANKYFESVTKKGALKNFELIADALLNDEEVVMCFAGLHNFRSASKHDGNFAYAITTKRIIMAQQKLVGQSLLTISLDSLNDITLSTNMVSGILTIDTMKEKFNVQLSKRVALNVNERIHAVLLTVKNQAKATPTPSVNPSSNADEILKYKNLLDMGAISQEEFDKKKTELLNL